MTITSLLDHPYVQTLVVTLTHFVWQGAALGLLAFVLLRFLKLTAETRYTIGVLTLAAMLAAPVITFAYLVERASPPGAVAERDTVAGISASSGRTADISATRLPVVGPATVPIIDSVPERSRSVAPAVIVGIWLSGVLLLSVRLFGGWVIARRLVRHAVRPVAPEIESLARRVAGRLALDRIVSVLESSVVTVPVMVGWIKPVVLLPAAALSGLGTPQLEALIAHELAHVRRHDYLVNLLQSIVETLLFYHPAVWWVSEQVRAEREHCCDDLAVGVCDRLVYVTALADLAALTSTPRVALAATDGSLVNRIRRLLGRGRNNRDVLPGWIPAVMLAIIVTALVPAGYLIAEADRPGLPVALPLIELQQPATGVEGGVRSGVPAGVSGGVAGGVAQGVRDGVSGGNATGVVGGVAGGINGAVAGSTSGLGWLADADVATVVEDPQHWRFVRDRDGRWRLVRPDFDRPVGSRFRLERDPSGKLRIVRDGGQSRREEELKQAEAELRARLAEYERAMQEMRKQLAQVRLNASAAALSELVNQQSAFQTKVDRDAAQLSNRLNLTAVQLAELRQAQTSQSTTSRQVESGTGNFVWSSDGDKVSIKWTGKFRLSADDRDIEWVEPGKSVQVSDGAWLFSTGVEVKATWDGRIERVYYKNAFTRPYDSEAGAFLAAMLQKVIRVSGFAAESRVARFLQQGGVNAVLAEIDLLQGDHARRVYYRELMKQAKLSPADITRVITRAGETIQSDHELSSLIITAAEQTGNDESARIAVIGATKTIGSDHDMRRALTAAMSDRPSPKVAAALLTAAAGIQGSHDRASFLIAFVQKGGLTTSTKDPFFALVTGINSSHDQGRVLRVVTGHTAAGADVISGAVKASQSMSGDYDRRQVLSSSIARDPVTASSAQAVIEAAGSMRSDNERGTVLLDLVKKGGVTNDTAASFFSVVAGMTSGYEQSRVLKAVIAQGPMSEPVLAGVLKAAASVRGEYERAELLVGVARKQPLTGNARVLYLAAADTIQSNHEQTRVLAELVRSERLKK